MNHTITGARSFNELMDADKTRPAIITFTHKKGNTYTGTIKGYMVNDRMPSQGTRRSGITITLQRELSTWNGYEPVYLSFPCDPGNACFPLPPKPISKDFLTSNKTITPS